jgi:hypothetical protein
VSPQRATRPSRRGPGPTYGRGVLITGRQATARLSGAGLPPRQARQVLDAGFAGTPIRTSAALLYDLGAVDALTLRPRLHPGELDELCPLGAFVARAGRRSVDVRQSNRQRLGGFREGWALGPINAAWLAIHVERSARGLPFLITVAGYVAGGADIVGVRAGPGRTYDLDLVAPGPWYAGATGRRLRTGPGREWEIRGLPRSAGARPVVGE